MRETPYPLHPDLDESRFRQLLEAAPDAMVIVDQEGRIQLVNSQTEALFGYRREEMLGQPVEMLIPSRFHERHGEHRAAYASTPRTRPMGAGLELFGRHQDGREIPVEISLSPLEVEEGLLISAAIRDISERKRAEQQLRHYAEELQRSNLELQQFAYVASHDLQEPLRAVAGFCDLLAQAYRGRLDTQADQWITFVVQGAQRMQALVQALLQYSRVENRAVSFSPIDVGESLAQAVINLQSAIADADAAVTSDPLPQVPGDRQQMTQLLQNLIGNAIKFHGPEPPRVHVSAQQRGDAWYFSVCDNGIGIAPEYHERIFEIFKRLHVAEEYPGTGIGLAVCRRIVHRHGGRIWVESEPDRGSTFWFTIPLEGSVRQPIAPEGASEP